MSTFESTAERELLDLTERTPPAFHPDELESTAMPAAARPHAAPPPIPAKARARATTALPLPPPPGERSLPPLPGERTLPPPSRDRATASLRTVPRPSRRQATLPPPIPARASGQHAAVAPPIPARASGQHAAVAPQSPARASARAATVPPPIPAAASARAATVPPPIPAAASARAGTMPPPIPARASGARGTVPPPIPDRARRPSTSAYVANPPVEDESVEVDLTPAPFPRVDVASTPSPDADAPLAADAARSNDGPPNTDGPRSTDAPRDSHAERNSDASMTKPRPKSAWDDFSALPPMPATRPRGTIPPLPSPANQLFVVAPTAQSGAQMFAAPTVPKVVSVAELAANDDPTPLPRPLAYGDFTNDFDRNAKLDLKPSTPRAVKWAAGAALVVGIIAIAFFATRAGLDGDKPTPQTSTNVAATLPTSQQVAQPTVDTATQPAIDTAAQPAVQPAPVDTATAPSTAEAQAPVAVESIADGIRVTSEPAGATVTLIDNGTMTELGTTPLAAKLDSARSYDLVIALAGYDTKVARVAPNTNELAVSLISAAPAQATAVATTEVPVKAERTAKPERKTKAVRTKPERDRSRSRRSKRTAPHELKAPTKSSTRVATAEPGKGIGTLMVSSKPPCEIVIDGVATVLTTPQRAIKLPAGKHKITLFNLRHKIDKTFEVTIEPKRATKLIRDFMTSRTPQG